VKSILVVATSNRGKLREFEDLLRDPAISSGLDFELRSLAEAGDVELPPEGDDYLANAVAKARTAAVALGHPALADDSGLEVAGLGGAPGPHSARYGGPDLDDAGRVRHLLARLDASSARDRTARFVCIAALALPDGEVSVARGICSGRIAAAPAGVGGFGYDPIFEVEAEGIAAGTTMAELSAERKQALSHRGAALRALAPALARLAGAQPSAAKRS
jgi:XTP/dITP diphosphohydrolase